MSENERIHDVDQRSARNEWRLNALDKWRDQIDARVAVLESQVNDIKFTEALAEALAEKIDRRRDVQFTIWQKAGGGLLALVTVAGAIRSLLH